VRHSHCQDRVGNASEMAAVSAHRRTRAGVAFRPDAAEAAVRLAARRAAWSAGSGRCVVTNRICPNRKHFGHGLPAAPPACCSACGSTARGFGSRLSVEVRIQALGIQGPVGLKAFGPLIRSSEHLLGAEALKAAIQRAENAA
jgi:hypothetical protein